MRAVAVLIGVVALAVGTASMGGASAASQPQPRADVGTASPSWSPDGKQIAFAYIHYARHKNCCGLPPSFTPGRYRIVRASSKGGGAVHTVLASNGYCCDAMEWAAGGRILLNPNIGLKSVGAQSGQPKRLLFPSCAGVPERGHKCQATGFILSPNREYAAVAVTTDSSDPHIPWGIGLVKLSPGRDPEVLSTPLTAEEGGPIVDWILAFSPDGKQLVFSRSSWDGWTAGPPALMAIPVQGGEPVPLAQSGIPGASLLPNDVQQAQWSPDGRWIAYVEGESLDVVSTTGGEPRAVPACGNGSISWEFSWSATSKSIAYGCFGYDAAKAPGSRWTVRFMTVAPDGTHLTNLLENRPLALAGLAQWSPDGSCVLFLAHGIGHRTVHVWTIRANGRGLTRIG